MEFDRKPVQRRFQDLVDERRPYEKTLKDIQRYINPTRGCFDLVRPNESVEIDHKAMVDSTPLNAAGTLAAGMLSGLTSPAMPWFTLGVADPDLNDYQPVRAWADTVRDRMMAVFAKSNFYDGLYAVYEELGSFGTGVVGLFEDYDNVIRTSWFTCGEYYLGVDHYGRANTFGRIYWSTVENLVREFGIGNVSHDVRRNWEENRLYVPVKVFHLIEPNDGRDPQRKDNRNMPFRSIYWEETPDERQVLRVSGYEQFPILAPRWGVRTMSDAYGRGSPGWKALGDSKMLQAMTKDELKGLARSVDPPLLASDRLKGEVINALPGGVTHAPTGDPVGVKPLYEIRPDLQAIQAARMDTQNAINQAFYVDLFRMLSQLRRGPQKTATEIVEMHREAMLLLAPVLERVETELLDPAIDRTFNIMDQDGLIPEPPDVLQGKDLKVEYISVLAQAQKMAGTAAIDEFTAYLGGVLGVDPQIIDAVDMDQLIREYAERKGVSAKILRSPEAVAKIRAERQKAEQQQAAMQQAGGMIQAAKLMSETDTSGQNALTTLLGGPGGGLR